jgi:hypothetical protein
MVLSIFLLAPVLSGSGSYASRLPTPGLGPGFRATEEMALYELGKALVAGRLQGSAHSNGAESRSEEERRNLDNLQSRLPPSAKKTIDLKKLQGLSTEQWRALRYFLAIRYKVK